MLQRIQLGVEAGVGKHTVEVAGKVADRVAVDKFAAGTAAVDIAAAVMVAADKQIAGTVADTIDQGAYCTMNKE